jgi:hypothetical protein
MHPPPDLSLLLLKIDLTSVVMYQTLTSVHGNGAYGSVQVEGEWIGKLQATDKKEEGGQFSHYWGAWPALPYNRRMEAPSALSKP